MVYARVAYWIHSMLMGSVMSGALSSQVLNLHTMSVAEKHGVQQGDVILGVSVLPVDGQEKVLVPKDNWSWEEVAEKISQGCSSQQVLVCIVQRSIDI